MATLIFKDAAVYVGSVNLSTRARQLTLNVSSDEHDDTVFGASYRSRKMGLKDWTLNMTFLQDYATSMVDATLWAKVGAAPFSCTVYPTGLTAGTGKKNLQFSGNVVLTDYNAVDGGVGDLMEVTASFMGAGTLTRTQAYSGV